MMKKAAAAGALSVALLIALLLGMLVIISADEDDSGGGTGSGMYIGVNLSPEVLAHQPMVEKYARQNGISDYVYVLLAIIQVESEGKLEDVSSPRNLPDCDEYARHQRTVSNRAASISLN